MHIVYAVMGRGVRDHMHGAGYDPVDVTMHRSTVLFSGGLHLIAISGININIRIFLASRTIISPFTGAKFLRSSGRHVGLIIFDCL